MENLVSQVEIDTIRKKKPHIIFVTGYLSTGKREQSKKIADEYRAYFVEMKKILIEESKKDTNEGKTIKQCLESGQEVPTNIKVKILAQSIIFNTKDTVLVEGFPENLDEALFFEKYIYPIKSIITFNAKPETCFKIFLEKCINQGRIQKVNPEIKKEAKPEVKEEPIIPHFEERKIDVKPKVVETRQETSKIERVPATRIIPQEVEYAAVTATSKLSDKEIKEYAKYILETNPSIRKPQANFFASHCTIGRYYSIQDYKKASRCAYETARTSMDNLAAEGFYKKVKIKNKFVYTPIKQEGR